MIIVCLTAEEAEGIPNRLTTGGTEEDLSNAYEETRGHEKNVNPIYQA